MPTYILLQNAKNDRNQSNSNPKVIHSPLKTQNSKLKTQNSKLKTQNMLDAINAKKGSIPLSPISLGPLPTRPHRQAPSLGTLARGRRAIVFAHSLRRAV